MDWYGAERLGSVLVKHSAFEVLSATLAPNASDKTAGRNVTFKQAHRHSFDYTPKPGFLYVRSRAISSRCNDNFDDFPAEDIKQAYGTFIGKPVFVNHNNENHRRARGVCIDAALHEDVNPDGSPDTWVEVLMEVDAIRFPMLAKAILAGHIDRTSMGTDVAYSICSFCGNRATTPLEYCAHIPRLKGKRIRRTTASGAKEDVLVREICHGLRFFENSLLVEDPADPTAIVWGVDASGLNATAARADDAYSQPRRTPPSYTPCPGSGKPGHIRTFPGDSDRCSHCGKWMKVRTDGTIGPHRERKDKSSSLQRSAALIAEADGTDMSGTVDTTGTGGCPASNTVHPSGATNTTTPCHVCGWPVYLGAWGRVPYHHPIYHRRKRKHHQTSLGRAAALLEEALQAESAYGGPPNNAKRRVVYGTPIPVRTRRALNVTKGWGVYMHNQDAEKVQVSAGVDAVAEQSWDEGGKRKYLVSFGGDQFLNIAEDQLDFPNGRPEVPDEAAQYDEKCSMSGQTIHGRDSSQWTVTCPECGASVKNVKGNYGSHKRAGAHRMGGLTPTPATSETHGPYRKVVGTDPVDGPFVKERLECGHPGERINTNYASPGKRRRCDICRRKESMMQTEAYGEVVAPSKVDTLRDELCPVCGEKDTYDGDKCMVCGYTKPPDQFMDPDLDKARNTDLHQEQVEEGGQSQPNVAGGDLECPECGEAFSGIADTVTGADPLTKDTGDEYGNDDARNTFGRPDPSQQKTDPDNAAKPDPDPAKDPAKLPRLPKPHRDPDDGLPQKNVADETKAESPSSTQKAGDPCPNCGKGKLQPKGDQKGGGDAFVPPTDKAPSKDDGEDKDQEDDDDDKDGKSDKKPPWLKGKGKTSALSRAADLLQSGEVDPQKEQSMRPALAALAEQQKVLEVQHRRIAALTSGLEFVAEAAGLIDHPAVQAALRVEADENNPAQPLPDPASEGPTETTDQALAPAGRDDPTSIGNSPVTDVAPAATTSVDQVGGTVADEALDLNEKDVTKPVAGTEGPRPLNEVKIETEQRIGPWQGNDPNPAFPLQGPFAERARTGSVEAGEGATEARTASEGRTWASLRLARLRIQAGIADSNDDLALGTTIASDENVTDESIQTEIETLSKIVQAQGQGRERVASRRDLVPQPATARTAGLSRTVPSMAPDEPSAPLQTVAMGPSDEEFLFE